MKNKLAVLLNEARRNGVSNGVQFMGGIVLIALNNIADEYIYEGIIGEFLKDAEKETNRIYQQVLDSVPSGEITEMAERIAFYVEDIRKRRGMDDDQSMSEVQEKRD